MPEQQPQTNAAQLSRTKLAQVLNGCAYAQRRKVSGFTGNIISGTAVGKWITEQACPTNPDGKTLNLADVCAWLAVRYKDGTRDRPPEPTSDPQKLADDMRGFIDDGDVVGLIGCLLGWVGDLETAKAVSQIVVNVINAEKGRVKAQADEYERRIRAGELLEAKTVEQGNIERCHYIRETLSTLGTYAPRLQGKTLVEIRAELETIGTELLNIFAGIYENNKLP